MSTPTPTPVPVPTPVIVNPPTPKPNVLPVPNAAPPWAQIVILLFGLYAAYLHGSTNPTPTPKPPTPIPAPIPSPTPIPTPTPVPHVDPIPLPPPTPTPSNAIVVSDAKGVVLTGGVDAGQLFYVSCATGSSIYGQVQPASTSGDIAVLSPNKILCTLKEGGRLQVFCYGTGTPFTSMVLCNHAPQPPPPGPFPPTPTPIPNPNPQPTPTPTPTPVPVPVPVQNRHVSIAIVEDGLNRSPTTAAILNNIKAWDAFLANGNTWTLYSPLSTEPKAVAAKAALTAANIMIYPAVVITDLSTGATVYTGDLKSMDPIKQFVNSYTGSHL